ncbi:MAG: 2,3-bisphosphoglycerate-independent phosphoglycerate mutase, partial [Mollicutes bacterium]|nr:2,3-bisphosphoglycerate-independent phosphoglycerate mutase [Mollicutes bacterium]
LLILTADHGNCEEMIDENNRPITSHSLNKVPFIVCNSKYIVKDGKLGDIAPTILTIMEMPIPQEMKGKILVEVKNGNI